jgi:hypothetical protein
VHLCHRLATMKTIEAEQGKLVNYKVMQDLALQSTAPPRAIQLYFALPVPPILIKPYCR